MHQLSGAVGQVDVHFREWYREPLPVSPFLQFMTAGQVSVSLAYRCAESFQHGSYNHVYSWIQRTERAKW